MRSHAGHSLAGALLALAMVAACGVEPDATSPSPGSPSPAPSASPVPSAPGSQAPSPTPAMSPVATAVPSASPSQPPSGDPSADAPAYRTGAEIRDILFAPDGRIVVVENDWGTDRSSIATLDEHGNLLPGWPWSAGDTGNPIADAALGPDGSVWVAVRGEATEPLAWSWDLHRLDGQARELPGFPVPLPDVPFCDLAVAPDGVAYAWCEDHDEESGSVGTVVRAVRSDGETVAGWPVGFDGSAAVAGFRPDGALVATVMTEAGPSVTVLRPDATVVDGWPRRVPDGESVMVDARGRVHVTGYAWSEGQCGGAERTTYTVLRRDGTTVPGWPIIRRGWASEPLVADDGSMTIVTEAGRAIRYGPDGEIVDGWPVPGIGVSVGCYAGSSPVSAGDDGSVVTGDGVATLLTPGGRVARGWPVDPPGRLALNCEDCTPGPGAPMAPAVGRNGTWIATYRGERPRVVGIARDGSLPAAWQRAIGAPGDQLRWIGVAPTGRVWAILGRWSNAAQAEESLLVPVAEDEPLAE